MTLPTDFDFLIDSWKIRNRRINSQGVWENFSGFSTGIKYLDGQMILDTYNAIFPSGFELKGLNIRFYNTYSNKWNIQWLDNYLSPDYIPLIGKFTNGIGTFEKEKSIKSGKSILIRFIWDTITSNEAHWRQEFSNDKGLTWDLQWEMIYFK